MEPTIISWPTLRNTHPKRYEAFRKVIDGCEFGGETPDRSEWEVWEDEKGVMVASCEIQPAASVFWSDDKGRWVYESEIEDEEDEIES